MYNVQLERFMCTLKIVQSENFKILHIKLIITSNNSNEYSILGYKIIKYNIHRLEENCKTQTIILRDKNAICLKSG